MSLYNILDITGSALSSSSVMLNTTASNLANAQSVSSSSGETYKAKYPVFQTLYQTQQQRAMGAPGVQVTGVTESHAEPMKKHAPDHPMADQDGFIYSANINVVEEMANMIAASRAYQTNLQVATTAKQLLQRTLTLGQ
jgi:flagellar basal-body rod protein FlgC